MRPRLPFLFPLAASFATSFAALLVPAPALGADVSVVGLFGSKAVLVVDGGTPKTYQAGTRVSDGIRLVAVSESGATLEINGRRETIAIGGHVAPARSSGRSSVTLQPDGRGHYIVRGQINGGAAQMLLDTGATMIAMPASDARRFGIDYRNGQVRYVNTANGTVPAYLVKLDRVKVGDIELHQVDALVQESGLSIILLGMSFLNRTDMRRDGEQMVLTKRF